MMLGASPRPIPAHDLQPVALAALMLATPFLEGFSSAALEPRGAAHVLSLKRGTQVLHAFEVDDEAAAAAVVRLAVVSHLEPIPEAGARTNVARVRVQEGGRAAEVLVSISAHAGGFEVEVRALSSDGREPSARAALRRCTKCGDLTAGYLERCERDGAELVDVTDSPILGGTVGPYRLEAELGSGGMGSVYAASHVLLDREVAIKLMHHAISRDSAAERRFLFEARVASRLRHPKIVNMVDFGVLADGRPYMVMERLRGTSLETKLEEHGTLDVAEAMRIGISMARALGAAHDVGVIHNDLKPSNVILLSSDESSREPPLKLIDFGAASLVQEHQAPIEVVYGTPAYMSPERVMGVPGDARSDLYSLGIVLYQLVSGRLPFDDRDAQAVFTAQREQDPPDLTTPHGPPPRAVGNLIARALRKSPNERYQSAGEMILDLEVAAEVADRPSWRKWLP